MRNYKDTYEYEMLKKLTKEEIIKRLITMVNNQNQEWIALKHMANNGFASSENVEHQWQQYSHMEWLLIGLYDEDMYESLTTRDFSKD